MIFNNLCNSCTNIGCGFQSDIVRTKCTFCMPPRTDWHDIPSDEMTLEQARQAVKELRKYVMSNHILSKSEDAISKQAVFAAMRNNYRGGGRDIDGDYIEGNYKKELYDTIISLPLVAPQSRKVWITTYWTKEIEPVVTPFDNQEAAETCAKYYEKQGYKVCIDKCNIFHKCTNTKNEE